MSTELMIHNANQIAAFFSAYPHEEAVAAIEDHLRKFWEPRLRGQLAGHMAAGGAGLHGLVVEAARRLS